MSSLKKRATSHKNS